MSSPFGSEGPNMVSSKRRRNSVMLFQFQFFAEETLYNLPGPAKRQRIPANDLPRHFEVGQSFTAKVDDISIGDINSRFDYYHGRHFIAAQWIWSANYCRRCY